MINCASFLLFPLFAQGEPCEPQNYSSPQSPDFSCPAQDELALVPNSVELWPASIPVTRGQSFVAPWDGILVHRDRLIELGLRLKAVRRLRWIDGQAVTARLSLEQRYRDRILSISRDHLRQEQERWQRENDVLRKSLASQGKWYRSFWFGYLMGTVVLVLAGGVVIYLLTLS